jgi:hypothetical protein
MKYRRRSLIPRFIRAKIVGRVRLDAGADRSALLRPAQTRGFLDRVVDSPRASVAEAGELEHWPLLRVAVILGMIMLVEALGLLAVGWRWFDLGADAGRLQTFTFETLLFFALFSMISVRERRAFWSSMPSAALSLGLAADACAGLLVAAYGLAELRPLTARELAVVVSYAFAFSLLVNDVIKRMLIARTRSSR